MPRPQHRLSTGPMVRLLRHLDTAPITVDAPLTGTLTGRLRGLLELGLAGEEEREGRRVYAPTNLGQRVLMATRPEVK